MSLYWSVPVRTFVCDIVLAQRCAQVADPCIHVCVCIGYMRMLVLCAHRRGCVFFSTFVYIKRSSSDIRVFTLQRRARCDRNQRRFFTFYFPLAN